VTYPNILVLDYMKQTDQISPEIQMEAEQFIAQGYQRLLTFEVPGGGFSLFGQPPAQLMLTAYGLMEFNDMARVHYVDPALIERTAQWLLAQQKGQGYWPVAGRTIESGLESVLSSEVPVTAYVAWALIEAGYEDAREVWTALDYLRDNLDLDDDSYVLALAANAFAGADPRDSFGRSILAELESRKSVDGDVTYWSSQASSFMGGRGDVANMETTALVAMAMLKSDAYPNVASGAINYLVKNKDSFGTWQTTQATILSLKALTLSALKGGEGQDPVTVRVSFNGEEADPVRINDDNSDIVHLVSFTDKAMPGENRLSIDIDGKRAILYQVTTEYFIPWSNVADAPAGKEALTIRVQYDRSELEVNDVVTADVQARLRVKGTAKMALLDLGIPPGFTVLAEDLAALVERGVFSRYEIGGRQVIIYVEEFSSDEVLTFRYRMRAKFPIKAQTPRSQAYDYYTPERQGEQPPQLITVNE
jgi:hypothetical protein